MGRPARRPGPSARARAGSAARRAGSARPGRCRARTSASAARQRRAVEGEHARVDLADVELEARWRRRAPWSRRPARRSRRARGRPARSRAGSSSVIVAIVAAAPLRSWAATSALIVSGREQRHIAVEHDARSAVARLHRSHRRPDGVRGAERLAPGRRARRPSPTSTGSSRRSGESTTTILPAPAARAAAIGHADERPPAQRMQQLRHRRAHARALASGEDDDDGRGHGVIVGHHRHTGQPGQAARLPARCGLAPGPR